MKMLFTYCFLLLSVLAAKSQVYVNHAAIGSNDGTSWTNAFVNLQDALDLSNPGDQIWIAAGTYIPTGPAPESSHFTMGKMLEVYGGFAGTESDLSERDWQAYQTIFSGDINGNDTPGNFLDNRSDNAQHIFIVDAGLSEVIIDGMVFSGGTTFLDFYAPDSTDILGVNRWRGGALYIRETPTTIRNCIFRDNNGYEGSSLFAKNANTERNNLVIKNCTFEGNNALNAATCMIWPWNECSIRECIFKENQAGNFGGGLVIVNTNSIIEDCSFELNFASSQGGACFFVNNTKSKFAHPSFQFKRCDFTANSAASSGGALHYNNYDFGFDLTFDSCTFNQNFTFGSGSGGGAVTVRDWEDNTANELRSSVNFIHTVFDGNTSPYGGGAYIATNADSLDINVSHSIFYLNGHPDDGNGGGLYITLYKNPVVQTNINHTLFEENTTFYGGGAICFDSYININPIVYAIDSCIFKNNMTQSFGGAIAGYVYSAPGPVGKISNSQFLTNQSINCAGAIYSYSENLLIENCLFAENYTQGLWGEGYDGGGAVFLDYPENASIKNSVFNENISEYFGAGLFVYKGANTRLENVLFKNNTGGSTIQNFGNLEIVNTTLVDNESGIFTKDSSYTEIQNSIFKSNSENLLTEGLYEITSMGGNISSDKSMTAVLTGHETYTDLHNTDPLLGLDYVPQGGSPCIDAGNPDGISVSQDLAGNPRIYGNNIDIGAYESFLVAVKDVVWDASGLTVFPNPVNDVLHFTLESDWTGDARIVLYNYLGQQVHRLNVIKSGKVQTYHEELNHLAPGQYVMLADMGHLTCAVHVIIQR